MTGSAAIECRNLYKIFGPRPETALAALRAGLGKADIKSRHDSVVGVHDVSFSVDQGEVFCVMGLSGSGKSTLVRHINRLVEPTAGSIFIQGEDIGRKSHRAMRKLRSEKIGMVFQNFALLPHLNVIDNVALGLELRACRATSGSPRRGGSSNLCSCRNGARPGRRSCPAACSSASALPGRLPAIPTSC